MTLRGLAELPKTIEGWKVEVEGDSVILTKGNRYVKSGPGEPWMSALALMHRGLEAASSTDVDLADPKDKELARENWRQTRDMAEAIVSRDRIAEVRKKG